MDSLGNGEMLTNKGVKFVSTICKKYFCVNGKFLGSFILMKHWTNTSCFADILVHYIWKCLNYYFSYYIFIVKDFSSL